MVKGDWEKVQRFAREFGRDPRTIGRVYSNFVWVLRPGEKPESAIPRFSVYSGMDLDYWRAHYLLGEAGGPPPQGRLRVAAAGGRGGSQLPHPPRSGPPPLP